MEKHPKNPKALLYCSVWPDERQELSLETQSVELQTYCLMNGLEVVDIISDIGPHVKGKLRAGMERLLAKAMRESVGHIVIHDVSRVGKDSREVMTFLRDTFDSNRTEVHISLWKTSTASAECARIMAMAGEILSLDHPRPVKETAVRSEKYRVKPLWIKLFGLLQDERYAELLIKALFQLKDTVKLTEKEYMAVHGGYDHLNMFRALGFRIKGEKTDNTKLVTDVLVRYWDKLKLHLSADLHRIIEGSETGAVL
ncbi:MAG TPA: recombinase family protein [Fibrobacteria bacterium]|nr:recombinase family protein [Fibrobacteria bacterium]